MGHSTMSAPYWPPELRARVPEAPGDPPGRPARMPPREGFEFRLHAQGRLALPGADHRGAADQRPRPADRLDERFPGHQRAATRRGDSRAPRQERLQATARLATVGEMASLLSHELNQPLAAISSYANGFDEPAGAAGTSAPTSASVPRTSSSAPPTPMRSHDVRMAMRQIAGQAERAGRVIKSVHDFVRRRDQAREAVHAAGSCSTPSCPWWACRRANWACRCTPVAWNPACPRVLCDRTMVEQVLLNLARNAMQAMDQPGVHRAGRADARCGTCGIAARRQAAGWSFRWPTRAPALPTDVAASSCSRRSSPPRPRHGPGPEPVPHGGRAARRPFLGFEPTDAPGHGLHLHLARCAFG